MSIGRGISVLCFLCLQLLGGIQICAQIDGVGREAQDDGHCRPISAADEIWRTCVGSWVNSNCPEEYEESVRECLKNWSSEDPLAALEFVLDAEKFTMRNDALAVPLVALARTTPSSEICRWIKSNLVEEDWSRGLESVIKQLAVEQPHRAAGLAQSEPTLVPAYLWGDILSSMIRSAPQDALDLYASLAAEDRREVASSMVEGWVSADLPAALQWCEQYRDSDMWRMLLCGIVYGLRETKPESILSVIEVLHLSPQEKVLIEAFQNARAGCGCFETITGERRALRRKFEIDADAALAAIRQLPSPEGQAEEFAGGWRLWQLSDRKSAERWLQAQSDPTLSTYARMKEQADRDPKAFIETIGIAPNNPYTETCLISTLAGLGMKDPAWAMRWLIVHPEWFTYEILQFATQGMTDKDGGELIQDVKLIPVGTHRLFCATYLASRYECSGDGGIPADIVSMTESAQDVQRYTVLMEMFRGSREPESALTKLIELSATDAEKTYWKTVLMDGKGLVLPALPLLPMGW